MSCNAWKLDEQVALGPTFLYVEYDYVAKDYVDIILDLTSGSDSHKKNLSSYKRPCISPLLSRI